MYYIELAKFGGNLASIENAYLILGLWSEAIDIPLHVALRRAV